MIKTETFDKMVIIVNQRTDNTIANIHGELSIVPHESYNCALLKWPRRVSSSCLTSDTRYVTDKRREHHLEIVSDTRITIHREPYIVCWIFYLEKNIIPWISFSIKWFNHVYILSLILLLEWMYQSNLKSKAQPEIGDGMRSAFLAKHISDSMLTDELTTCRHYNVTLDNSHINNIMLISR